MVQCARVALQDGIVMSIQMLRTAGRPVNEDDVCRVTVMCVVSQDVCTCGRDCNSHTLAACVAAASRSACPRAYSSGVPPSQRASERNWTALCWPAYRERPVQRARKEHTLIWPPLRNT